MFRRRDQKGIQEAEFVDTSGQEWLRRSRRGIQECVLWFLTSILRLNLTIHAVVSRAFQILSDPDKKSKYDKFGGDPDSRFGAGASASGASPFSGFASQRAGPRHGDMFGEEISPEDLFRQFFGGGFGGQAFGGPFGGEHNVLCIADAELIAH